MDISSLSPEQRYAFNKFTRGENLFITGPGGTGKTNLIKYMVHWGDANNKKYQVCALTGCAALLLNCGARTIHSWSGIKLAKGPNDAIIRNVCRNRNVVAVWKKIQVLIVDEVSMMSKKIFDILEEIGRTIRRNSRPFGGIQVIFTGDFFQLPPVGNITDPDTELFCFESERWRDVFKMENHIELVTMFRQTDPIYANMLLEIRRGKISEENKKILQNYVKREHVLNESGIVPTKLFATKNKVEYINNMFFDRLEEQSHEFKYKVSTDCISYLDTGKIFPPEIMEKCRLMTFEEKQREVEYMVNNMPCSQTLVLKKGAVVMCTYNVDLEEGICNGSQGIIVGFSTSSIGRIRPVVKFTNGIIITMEPQNWQSDDYPCIAVTQYPLCLAWALTIHKIQGATMNMAEMDVGNSIFEYGQVYVALSRIKSLDGLYLQSFNPMKIKANPRVIEFYNSIPAFKIEDYKDEEEKDKNGMANPEPPNFEDFAYKEETVFTKKVNMMKTPTFKVVKLNANSELAEDSYV